MMMLDRLLLPVIVALGTALVGLWVYDRTIYAHNVYQSGVAAERARETQRILDANRANAAADMEAAVARAQRLAAEAAVLGSLRVAAGVPSAAAYAACDLDAATRDKLNSIGGAP